MCAWLRGRCRLQRDLALRGNRRPAEELAVRGDPAPELTNARLHLDLGTPPHQALRFLNVADVARLIARPPVRKPHRDLLAIQFSEDFAKLVPYGQRITPAAADVEHLSGRRLDLIRRHL